MTVGLTGHDCNCAMGIVCEYGCDPGLLACKVALCVLLASSMLLSPSLSPSLFLRLLSSCLPLHGHPSLPPFLAPFCPFTCLHGTPRGRRLGGALTAIIATNSRTTCKMQRRCVRLPLAATLFAGLFARPPASGTSPGLTLNVPHELTRTIARMAVPLPVPPPVHCWHGW